MRVVLSIYDSPENPYYAGGGPVVLDHIANRLKSRYKVTIVSGNYPGASDFEKDGVLRRFIGLPDRFSSLISYQFLLPYYAAAMNYDLWLESFTPPFGPACLPLVTRKPVLGLAHLLCGTVMKQKYGIPFDLYEAAAMRLYPTIIVPTEEVAEGARAITPKSKIVVIPNGVDMPSFCPISPSERFILFLGRLDWRQKGLDMLVRAYAAVSDRIPQKLYIAGHGTARDEEMLTNLIRVNGLESRVVLKGRVSGADKQALLASAELVVIPSRYEGMALVVLEAFAHRKPVICFETAGFGWFKHGVEGLKARPFSVSDYAQLLLTAAADDQLRRRMGQNAAKLVRNYSWERTAAAYEDVISTCLQREKRR